MRMSMSVRTAAAVQVPMKSPITAAEAAAEEAVEAVGPQRSRPLRRE
jgi:hypothetical protein